MGDYVRHRRSLLFGKRARLREGNVSKFSSFVLLLRISSFISPPDFSVVSPVVVDRLLGFGSGFLGDSKSIPRSPIRTSTTVITFTHWNDIRGGEKLM